MRHDIYDWQPVLRRGAELQVVMPDEWSELLLAHIAPEACGKLDDLLEHRMHFIDDVTWSQRLAAELELDEIRLDLRRRATVKAGVHVRGGKIPCTIRDCSRSRAG